MSKDLTLNAYCAVVNSAMVRWALLATHLRWHMPPAQVASLEELQLSLKLDEILKAAPDKPPIKLPFSSLTLCGIAVQVDSSMPQSSIELRDGEDGDQVILARIENLAIPNAFSEYQKWRQ